MRTASHDTPSLVLLYSGPALGDHFEILELYVSRETFEIIYRRFTARKLRFEAKGRSLLHSKLNSTFRFNCREALGDTRIISFNSVIIRVKLAYRITHIFKNNFSISRWCSLTIIHRTKGKLFLLFSQSRVSIVLFLFVFVKFNVNNYLFIN